MLKIVSLYLCACSVCLLGFPSACALGRSTTEAPDKVLTSAACALDRSPRLLCTGFLRSAAPVLRRLGARSLELGSFSASAAGQFLRSATAASSCARPRHAMPTRPSWPLWCEQLSGARPQPVLRATLRASCALPFGATALHAAVVYPFTPSFIHPCHIHISRLID